MTRPGAVGSRPVSRGVRWLLWALWAAIIGLVVAMVVAVVGNGSADASATSPEFGPVTQDPAQIVFDSNSEHFTLVQEMSDPNAWTVDEAHAYVCTGNDCSTPGQYHEDVSLLKYDTQVSQDAQVRKLRFVGDLPNSRRSFSYYLAITYDRDAGAGVDDATYVSYTTGRYSSGEVYYYGWDYVSGVGDTKLSIVNPPSSVPPNTALTLSGSFTCYGAVGYKAPDEGNVYVQYHLPSDPFVSDDPENPDKYWHSDEGAMNYNRATGEWKFTDIDGVATTLDWRVRGWGYFANSDYCEDAVSDPVQIVAGSGPPPAETVTLPGKPGLSVGQVTATTAALNWSPPTSAGTEPITGYRFGWTSDSGLPVPSWNKVYPVSTRNPFVMTNLSPNSDYTMYVEAVTAKGPGARATVRVHTAAQPPPVVTPPPPGGGGGTPPPPPPPPPGGGGGTPPPPPPPPPGGGGGTPPPPVHPPSVGAPSAPRGVHGRAGSHRAKLWWSPPARGRGIDKYQVHRYTFDRRLPRTARSYVFRGLKNNATYTLLVRAHNRGGWGPWSRAVQVRPHR